MITIYDIIAITIAFVALAIVVLDRGAKKKIIKTETLEIGDFELSVKNEELNISPKK